MRVLITLIMVFMLSLSMGCARQLSQQELASMDFGPYPENYQEIVVAAFTGTLHDPYSAHITFHGEPKHMYGSTVFGAHWYGWGGIVYVNAKNRLGAYVGQKTWRYIIRYGKLEYFAEDF